VPVLRQCKTSYFDLLKKGLLKTEETLSISRNPPDWYEGHCVRGLSPSVGLLKAKNDKWISDTEFTKQYIKEIEERIEGQYDRLARLLNGKVLLCFEKPDKFCHRHVLAEWLRTNLNFTVEEFSPFQAKPATVDNNEST
jgi:hypothetical protein